LGISDGWMAKGMVSVFFGRAGCRRRVLHLVAGQVVGVTQSQS
jgi:hypothetical protein